jgi:hypothetical protein
MMDQWLWIMVCYAEQVVVNHGVLCLASDCESWCVMLSPVVVNRDLLCWVKWLWIMMWYTESSGWESWCVMPNQWLWIVMYYDDQSGYDSWCSRLSPVDGNHGVLCQTSGCESLFVMLSQWLWILAYYPEPVVMNIGVLCWASGCE